MPLNDHASELELLVRYYSAELSPDEETAIEDHWASCSSCAAAAAEVASLVGGVTSLVANGSGLWAITPELLQRFHDRGLHIREAGAGPGGALDLGDTGGFDLLIGRLRGDFGGLREVDVVFDMKVGTIVEARVPVTSEHELIIACTLHLRAPPGTRVNTRCTLRSPERVVGEYDLGFDIPSV